ncbi:glycoside hydrolase family 13 protein [Actinotalea sp. Marseille-Q4924]|uniref:glycoside hydrolase family 13 protein n=1 Tax=Actinotalea sp. Marseille-Q4924 TaxID=2866571 RepID=UPI001CE44987|nr:glycoside hydrolase family 13 protein [Actinotalea sp. Marseille-Q4924]
MSRRSLDAHHDGSELYVPAGTPALGDRVPVRVRVPSGSAARAVHLRTVRDGEPEVTATTLDREDEHERWYVAEVEVHNPVTHYRFLLDEPDGHRWLNGTGLHARDVPDAADFRLTVHPGAPGWAHDAVVYQVFPDRFARSGVRRPAPDWALPAGWDDEPLAAGPGVGQQLFGGDLRGIERRLDHLERLGVDVLYLTPFFPGRSNHRYDASTFDHVDPVLGGDEALASLSRAVHARGMRLVGDLTTNHTGAGHEWFRRAQADRDAEEASFYLWTDDGYVSWLGHDTLPKLDHASSALGRRLVDGPDSVIGRWLRDPYALDGWRIDVANMTGRYRDQDLTHEVARRVRRTMTDVRPDALLVGEHFHDASLDLPGDGWHATMNYTGFTRPVWGWTTPVGSEQPALGLPVRRARRSGAAAVATMREFAAVLPWRVTAAQWNMLGSHDTARISTLVGDRGVLEVAVGLLMTYPGTPMVFAGDEVGATGTTGEHARVTMPWDRPDDWDAETFGLYRSLIALRRESPALRRGGLRWWLAEDDVLAYLRETPEERVLVVAARAPWSGASVPAALLDGGTPEVLHGPDPVRAPDGGVHVPGDGPALAVWRLP